MTDHTYKLIELTGSSTSSIEDAVHNAVGRAAKTIHNMRWVELTNLRGHIENDEVRYWQVTLKIGFTLEE